MEIKYIGKDQNWQNNSSTVYWFELTGEDYGTGASFDGDVFGVVEDYWSSSFSAIVDCYGYPIDGNGNEVAIRRALENAVNDRIPSE